MKRMSEQSRIFDGWKTNTVVGGVVLSFIIALIVVITIVLAAVDNGFLNAHIALFTACIVHTQPAF